MKPNHNIKLQIYYCFFVVYTMSKIQNETKSQQTVHFAATNKRCLYYVKDTKWNQSQLQTAIGLTEYVVYTMSKIQNETKSQPSIRVYKVINGCLYYVKDTKWNQITTEY